MVALQSQLIVQKGQAMEHEYIAVQLCGYVSTVELV